MTDDVREGEVPEAAPDADSSFATVVAWIWSEALGLPGIRFDDNVFDLGAHSLLIIEVAQRIELETGISVPLLMFFERPTPRQIGAYLDSDVANDRLK